MQQPSNSCNQVHCITRQQQAAAAFTFTLLVNNMPFHVNNNIPHDSTFNFCTYKNFNSNFKKTLLLLKDPTTFFTCREIYAQKTMEILKVILYFLSYNVESYRVIAHSRMPLSPHPIRQNSYIYHNLIHHDTCISSSDHCCLVVVTRNLS